MTGKFEIIKLNDMISELGEDRVKEILSNFYCPKNKDVEEFLRVKAIEFSKQSLASTHLIFLKVGKKLKLIAYFTLSNKFLSIGKDSLSKTLRKRISKFATFDSDSKKYILGSILIGQLGKNYYEDVNKYISGDELLKIACDKVKNVQADIGGKIVYLECEDKDVLVNFYESNGFVNFGRRSLDRDETDKLHGNYLIQFLKYL